MNEHLNPASPNPANTVTPLVGTTWVLSEVRREGTGRAVPLGVRASITFDDGRASVEAGCNRGSVEALIGNESIAFGPMALTRMMCAEDAMSIEHDVCAVLQGEVPYAWQGHVLVLGVSPTALVYRSDLSLAGDIDTELGER